MLIIYCIPGIYIYIYIHKSKSKIICYDRNKEGRERGDIDIHPSFSYRYICKYDYTIFM